MLPRLEVTTPLSAQAQPEKDRRSSPRWRLEFPVTCFRPPENREEPARSADLSAGGMGCAFESACEVGTEMRVRFTLPHAHASFELPGVVKSANGGRIGIQFSSVDDAKAARLLAAIFQEIAGTNRPDSVADIADIGALEERLARIENAISLVSSAIKRESLEEEAGALRALVEAKKKATAVVA